MNSLKGEALFPFRNFFQKFFVENRAKSTMKMHELLKTLGLNIKMYMRVIRFPSYTEL